MTTLPNYKPLSSGGLIDAALTLYRYNFRDYFLIALVAFLIPQLPSILIVPLGIGEDWLVYGIAQTWSVLVGIAAFYIYTSMMVLLAAAHWRGEAITWQEALKQCLGFIGRNVLATIIVYGSLVVFGAVVVGAGAALIAVFENGSDDYSLLIPVFMLVIFVLLIWATYFILDRVLCTCFIMLEDISAMAGIRRNVMLMKRKDDPGFFAGPRWRLGIGLSIYSLLAIAVIAMFGSVVYFIFGGLVDMDSDFSSVTSGFQFILGIAGLATNAFCMPWFMAYTVVFYYDLVARHEGLDLLDAMRSPDA